MIEKIKSIYRYFFKDFWKSAPVDKIGRYEYDLHDELTTTVFYRWKEDKRQ